MAALEDMDDIVQEFLVESHENLDQLDRDLVALEQRPTSHELLSSIFRTIHTIKGTSGFLAFTKLDALTHAGENLLTGLRDGQLSMTPETTDALLRMVDDVRTLLANIEHHGTEGTVDVGRTVAQVEACLDVHRSPSPPAGEQPHPGTPERGATSGHRPSAVDATVRVDVDQLDLLMRLVGELVLTRNQLVQRVSAHEDPDLLRMTQRLNAVTRELQEGVMQTRMQPIEHLWSRMPRVVRDLAATLGKQVSLEMHGKETELDRTLLEAIKDPLTHLLRNAIDHGIETPDVRRAAGKPETGLLRLRAFHEGGQVVVEVADDGAGIDAARIGARAVERGLVTDRQVTGMAERDVLGLVFRPGFSTAATVTSVSGRGVGMDVVRTNIEKIGGSVELSSTSGEGSVVRLTVPLTLAIVPALTVECSGERYAVPQVSLLELVSVNPADTATAVEHVAGAAVYRLRGRLLPLLDLADVLDLERRRRDAPVVIAVLESEGRSFGLIVDRVLNSEEIVVKPLSSRLRRIGPYSGATILGDGAVALILDIQALAARNLDSDTTVRAEREPVQDAQVSPAERLLVAQVAGDRRVAIPLDMVTRLDELPADRVQHVGSREVVEYGGRILPLVRLSRYLGHYQEEPQGRLPMIVSSRGGRSVALVVDRIVDILDEGVESRSDVDDVGLLGSALIQKRVVELLDVRRAILAADPRFPLDPEPLTFGGT